MSGLPADLAESIEQLCDAIGYAASTDGRWVEDERCDDARAALEAAILKTANENSRLRKAIEDLLGDFHEDSDAYAKLSAVLSAAPSRAGERYERGCI